MWGTYCCHSEKETNSTDALKECNGSDLSLNSTCCENNHYVRCNDDRGCKDRYGKPKIVITKKLCNSHFVSILMYYTLRYSTQK